MIPTISITTTTTTIIPITIPAIAPTLSPVVSSAVIISLVPNNLPPLPMIVVGGVAVGDGRAVVGTGTVDIVGEEGEGELPKTNQHMYCVGKQTVIYLGK